MQRIRTRKQGYGGVHYHQNANKSYSTNTLKGFLGYDHSSGSSFLNGKTANQYTKPLQRHLSPTKMQIFPSCG
ncbi:MAG: hypothetical protein PUH24_04800 [Prevotellaceae bacterium]|nr:hypothetical protein [Prevotella sp.]MDD7257581.1 hypothetical protein [Prevotellaceae bacterium]MDY6130945.1 hypothetical protein [Prevotella sp.]